MLKIFSPRVLNFPFIILFSFFQMPNKLGLKEKRKLMANEGRGYRKLKLDVTLHCWLGVGEVTWTQTPWPRRRPLVSWYLDVAISNSELTSRAHTNSNPQTQISNFVSPAFILTCSWACKFILLLLLGSLQATLI